MPQWFFRITVLASGLMGAGLAVALAWQPPADAVSLAAPQPTEHRVVASDVSAAGDVPAAASVLAATALPTGVSELPPGLSETSPAPAPTLALQAVPPEPEAPAAPEPSTVAGTEEPPAASEDAAADAVVALPLRQPITSLAQAGLQPLAEPEAVASPPRPERETRRSPPAPAPSSPALPWVIDPQPPLAQQATAPPGADIGAQLGQMMRLLEQTRGNGSAPASASPSISDVINIVKTLTDQPPAARPAAEPAARPPREALPEPSEDPEFEAPAGDDARATAAEKTQIEEGEDGLSIHIQNADLRGVLELLSEQGGLNILASKSVQGTVSASLNGVEVEEALEAILKTVGYISRRDGAFIYVGTPQDFEEVDRAVDQINTRVYRPNYTPAAELEKLLTPLITPDLGKISVTTAAEVGIGGGGGTSSSSGGGGGSTGGDSYASAEAVVVQDYESVLEQIDQVIEEIDRRPLQVAIEAMILSVRLNDSLQAGIDWDLLRQQENIRFGIGQPRQAPIEGGGNRDAATGGAVGAFQYGQGGLTFAFMDADLSSFITFLETIGDTNVIATPRLMCLNKQRAEILIGAQLGYISTTITETSTAQNVQFLEVGAQLRLRPFISSDGLIRMEVHPELSTGTVRTQGGFTLPDKEVTQVTTNIMTRDGCTVIIGGLMREDLSTTSTQVPILGNLPAVGFLFRQKTETIERRELLVLVTPHIVYDEESAAEGERGAMEFHRRQTVRADKMSPAGKRLLGRKYFRAAQAAWEAGDYRAAARYIKWAVQFDPENRAAIDLQVDIMNGRHDGKHSSGPPVLLDPEVAELAGPLPEWVIDELGAEPSGTPLHPLDPGTPGTMRTLEKNRPGAK